jgi:hypothetical protein
VFVFPCGPELQYFIPSAKKGINRQIELAILRADKMGVKVISLAALNKVTIGSSLLIWIQFRTSSNRNISLNMFFFSSVIRTRRSMAAAHCS